MRGVQRPAGALRAVASGGGGPGVPLRPVGGAPAPQPPRLHLVQVPRHQGQGQAVSVTHVMLASRWPCPRASRAEAVSRCNNPEVFVWRCMLMENCLCGFCRCPIPTCPTPKWRGKRLRPLPSRWADLPPQVKEPIIKEFREYCRSARGKAQFF